MDNNQNNINQDNANQDNISQDNTVQETKKRRKGHGPLYWIIVIIGVAFIMYMSILIGEKVNKTVNPDNNIKNSKEEVNSNSNSNDNTTENKEQKITDKVKINYLKKYITILENLKLDTSSIKVSESAEYNYFMPAQIYALDKLEKKDITADLATIAMVGSAEGKRGIAPEMALDPATLKYFGANPDSYEYVSINELMDDYKTLFGFENISTKTMEFKCSTYVYDNKANVFVLVANGCGIGGPVAEQLTYIYDITEDKDNVYAYIAYGVTGQNASNQFVAYTDYKMSQKYTGNVTKDFTINESNYDSFSKYKYTFTKNSDGTYTFKEFSLLK